MASAIFKSNGEKIVMLGAYTEHGATIQHPYGAPMMRLRPLLYPMVRQLREELFKNVQIATARS